MAQGNRLLIRTLIALQLATISLAPAIAQAGRRPFVNVWDTETLKKGDVELEEWLWWREGEGFAHGWIWFAPVLGLSERVELAFPWEAVISSTETTISDFAAEARIQLSDPHDDTAPVHQLVRVFLQQNMNHPYNNGRYGIPWFGGNFVTSFGDVKGSHATLDIGAYSDFRFKTAESLSMQTLGAGYAHEVSKEVRLGVEYSHEIGLSSAYSTFKRYYAGPDFAFSRGNVWMTFGMLKGLTDSSPDFLARFIFAVAI